MAGKTKWFWGKVCPVVLLRIWFCTDASGPRWVGAVAAVEVIVVLNQWNMYGPPILSCVMNITVGKVLHMRMASWSTTLKIWDPLHPNAWCVCLAAAAGAQNCPSRRQTISHRRQRQPPRRAHSRRSPISTESHHEIGLQTGKCFIFSLQLTLIRRIPGPSGHIVLFTPHVHFSFTRKLWHVCLEWLPACLGFFFPRTPYQWSCLKRS